MGMVCLTPVIFVEVVIGMAMRTGVRLFSNEIFVLGHLNRRMDEF